MERGQGVELGYEVLLAWKYRCVETHRE